MNNPISKFYYSATLPTTAACAIAQITGPQYQPSDLIDITNVPISGTNYLDQGNPPGVWLYSTIEANNLATPDYTTTQLNTSLQISGSAIYVVNNQLFEITNIVDANNNPLYYMQVLPQGVTNPVITDLSGNLITSFPSIVINNSPAANVFYHSADGGAYLLRYINPQGYIQTSLLRYTPAISQSQNSVTNTSYTLVNGCLTLYNDGTYYIRFTGTNGLQVIPPYSAPSNVPWYVRIRTGCTLPIPEYNIQPFVPLRPYLFSAWTNGTFLSNGVIQFERQNIYFDGLTMPDIIVFDSNFNIKYALDGTPTGQISDKGYVYPWRKGNIVDIDPAKARVQVSVALDPTDIIFGFYSYAEYDYLYTSLDINPFTNRLLRNAEVEFDYKTLGSNLNQSIYYTVYSDSNGSVLTTNDDLSGSNQIFSYVAAGGNISTSNILVTDIRQRGGGLTESGIALYPTNNYWDLGFWDGAPTPIGGCCLVYLPISVLNILSSTAVQALVQAELPLGCLAEIIYYNPDDSEVIEN